MTIELFFVPAGKLGANAILGVSLAVCKAGAAKKVRKNLKNRHVYLIFLSSRLTNKIDCHFLFPGSPPLPSHSRSCRKQGGHSASPSTQCYQWRQPCWKQTGHAGVHDPSHRYPHIEAY